MGWMEVRPELLVVVVAFNGATRFWGENAGVPGFPVLVLPSQLWLVWPVSE